MYANEIIGGLILGLSSALPLLYEGRVAGISGYCESSLLFKGKQSISSLLLILGIVLGAFFAGLFVDFPHRIQATPVWLSLVAGFLVGLGSRMAGGCTSGHGICGLGRLSKRSFVSVLIFMGVAILIASIRGQLS